MAGPDLCLHFAPQVGPRNLCYCCPRGAFPQCHRASSRGYQRHPRAEVETGGCLLLGTQFGNFFQPKGKAATRQNIIVWVCEAAEIGGDLALISKQKLHRLCLLSPVSALTHSQL